MTRGAVPPISRRERRAQARLDRPPEPRHRTTRRATAKPAWQSPVVLVSAAAVLIGIAVIAFARPPAARTGGDLIAPPTTYAANLVDGENLGLGAAPVALELYSDFQCPACKQFVTLQLPRLVTEFVNPGTLRIVARDIDLIGKGTPNESLEVAAGAACAAAQGRYWQFHDYVFWNQGRENLGDHDAAFIAAVADAAGVNRTDWDACMAQQNTRTAITAQTTAAFAAGIKSTPTLVINGQHYVGVPSYDQLAALIRQLAASPAPSPS